MENKKFKKVLLALSTGAITLAPIVATIACGSSSEKDVVETNPVEEIGNVIPDIPHYASEANADIIGTFSNDWRDSQPDYWGYGRAYDVTATDSFAPAEYQNRKTTGMPMSPTLDIEDLWNWSPQGTLDGSFPAGDNRDPSNLPVGYDPAVANPGWSGDSNYGYEAGAGIENTKNPNIEYNWGAVDGEFNRATVREVAPRTFGEKLKDTQSAISKFSQMNWYSNKNGNNALGYTPGQTSTIESHVQDYWAYTHDFVTWGGGKSLTIKMPTGAQIDTAHRNGVPIIGTIYMFSPWATGESEHDQGVMVSPGPDGDFPMAKGMVELADYYGFDGWMVDWESHTADHKPFMDALEEYSHADYNYDIDPDDGITIPDTRTDIQKEYDYYHKPQYVTSYYTNDIVNPRSDISYYVQRNGNDATPEGMRNLYTIATNPFDPSEGSTPSGYGKDTYFPTGSLHFPENGVAKSKHVLGEYYTAANDHGNLNGWNTTANQISIWNYSKFELSLEADEKFYSSETGDPRVIDPLDKWSVSNSYQERTSIVGRNDFATTFDYGSGLNMNIFGGENIVHGMTTSDERGWKDPNMQSYLPTYRWIVDEWNASGTATVSDSNPHQDGVNDRKITPMLDNTTESAWLGGTTMTYEGILADKEKMANKLFASAVPVIAGDTVTIKIKDNGSDTVIPDFAAWTIANTDLDTNYDRYAVLSDGDQSFENGENIVLMDGTPMIVNAEESWFNSTTSTLKTISPIGEAVKKGDTGYLEVTYSLDAIANHEMRAFGISVTADGETDMSNLTMGEMKFLTKDSTIGKLDIENFQTTGTWDSDDLNWANVRVDWDVTSDSTADVRNYFVFLADDDFVPYSLAWNGANTSAYLTRIKKDVKAQNILVIAVDENYNRVMEKKINMKVNQ